jgi:hypothetical protein
MLRLFFVWLCILTAGVVSSSAVNASAFNDPGARSATAGGGDLVPVERDVDGGEITVGATAQVIILYRNDSGRPITVGAIQPYPSSTVSSDVSLNECTREPLPAGAVCAVALSVKGLQQGNWRIEVLMRHSGRSRLVTTTVSGQILGGDPNVQKFVSDVEIIPDELDFGTLNSSQPIIKGIVVRNILSDPIDINAIYVEASEQAGYSLRTDCTRLEPGQACVVTVKWSPVLEGAATGVLLIEHSGPTTISSVNLDGSFDPDQTSEAEVFPEAVPGKGLLVSSQEEVDFGDDIDSTSAITISLVNVGDAPLTLKDISLANSDNGLSLGGNGCANGTILAPVEACPMTVSWNPVRVGEVLDDVKVTHDGARGVLILPVRGEATGVISVDTKPLRLSSVQTVSVEGDGEDKGEGEEEDKKIIMNPGQDPASVLDGFVVTSHSKTRAIITGPGGSRIIRNGKKAVIGGYEWSTRITESGIEFANDFAEVLLLFDQSLSSFNRVTQESGRGSRSSSSSSSTASDSSSE